MGLNPIPNLTSGGSALLPAYTLKSANSWFKSGYSYPAGKVVNFAASYLYAVGSRVNWREVLICPVTGLNNRMRATAHILDMEFGIHPDDAIYISEQATPFYPGFPFWPWHGHRIHPRCAEYHVFSR